MKTNLVLAALMAVGVTLSSCDPYNAPASTETEQPEGSLSGLFSVGGGTKVYFSQGNLQYCAASNTYRFAEHQYDYCGSDNALISDTCSCWIDLFGWGTGNNPTKHRGSEAADEEYRYFMDWGANPIQNGGEGGEWRTMESRQWEYLFKGRKNAEKLYGSAEVCGVNGVILLPDGWTAPTGISFEPGMQNPIKNVYGEEAWPEMEALGAVFLPAAGYRNDEVIRSVEHYGSYWSRTQGDNNGYNAYYLYFGGFNLNPQLLRNRASGFSVRLVHEL